jgi:hypothetical protein
MNVVLAGDLCPGNHCGQLRGQFLIRSLCQLIVMMATRSNSPRTVALTS